MLLLLKEGMLLKRLVEALVHRRHTLVKIHILGGPGSGKTTLAQELASRLSIPHFELDRLGEKNGEDEAAYIEDAFAISTQPSWITDGVFLIWTEPLLYHADYIVLCEVPWRTAAWRIIFRHISKSIRGINPYPGLNGLKSLLKLLEGARNYCLNRDITDPATLEYIQLYLDRRRENATPPDAAYLLAHIQKYTDVVFAPTADFVDRYLASYRQKIIIVSNQAEREHLFKLLTKA